MSATALLATTIKGILKEKDKARLIASEIWRSPTDRAQYAAVNSKLDTLATIAKEIKEHLEKSFNEKSKPDNEIEADTFT